MHRTRAGIAAFQPYANLHRITCPPCNSDCNQGDDCPARQPAEACTEVGADTRPAALSMHQHRTAGRVALALLAAPAVAALVAVGVFIARHY